MSITCFITVAFKRNFGHITISRISIAITSSKKPNKKLIKKKKFLLNLFRPSFNSKFINSIIQFSNIIFNTLKIAR